MPTPPRTITGAAQAITRILAPFTLAERKEVTANVKRLVAFYDKLRKSDLTAVNRKPANS